MARKAAAGTGTIRKKIVVRNGKTYTYWEARYTVGKDPGTGKQIQRSISGKTQKEVAQKLKEATHDLDTGLYIAPNKMPLSQWMDTWLDEYCMDIKDSTRTSYKGNSETHIKPALGAVRMEDLTPHHIQSFYNNMVSGGLSPSTVRYVHAILRMALSRAQKCGYIRFNPANSVTLPRLEKKTIHPLDEEQSKAFMEAIHGHKYEVLFTVALFTGMRKGELLGLMWDCIDFDKGTILIDKQLQRGREKGQEYRITSTKSGKARTIAVAPWVMQLLKQLQVEERGKRIRAGDLWQETGYVFTNANGQHLAFMTVTENFKKIVASIGLPNTRFHDLRHSYAVAAIRSGVDIKTIQSNLGHTSITITLDIYGHVTEQMKQSSAERMEGYIHDILDS